MNKIKDYFIYRKSFYIFSVLIISIFYLILFLYNVLVNAINYATILSISFILMYMIYDYIHFFKKTKTLEYLLSLESVYTSDLPTASSLIEIDYQNLLLKLDDLHHHLRNEKEQEHIEMLDYFTLWVHQVKTPISALRLLIQSGQYTQMDLIIQIHRIEQYVEMALNYIKIKDMNQDLRIERYVLKDIVNEVVKKQSALFIQKKIKVSVKQLDKDILTDQKWISFVIEQILSNALKYTNEGMISIYENDDVLYIEDTGIGIKEEDLPRVFDKGFTGYNGRIDKKASGLGLYLCKQIIDNLGYHISIESVLEKGTRVAIDFHIDTLNVE